MGTFSARLGFIFPLYLFSFFSGGEDPSAFLIRSSSTAHILRLIESSVSASEIQCPPQSSLSFIRWFAAYLNFSVVFSFFSGFFTTLSALGSCVAELTYSASAFLGIPSASAAPRGDFDLARIRDETEQIRREPETEKTKAETAIDMPYVIPSAATGSSVSTFLPASPSSSRPVPTPLSIALSRPAPVPAHTPFTPLALPASPPLASSSAFNAQPGPRSLGMGYIYPPPPLAKAHSDSCARPYTGSAVLSRPPPPSFSPPSVASSSSLTDQETRQAMPIRRTASAPSVAPAVPSTIRYANAAGRGLPHIPRRRGGGSLSMSPASSVPEASATTVVSPSAARGRGRSRFVLGGEEDGGSGSGSEEEQTAGKPKKSKAKEDTHLDVDERAARKRLVSAEKKSPLVASPTSYSFTFPTPAEESHADHDHSDSGSECATPTPASVARERKASEGDLTSPAQVFASTETSETRLSAAASSVDRTSSSIPGIAPRARRGRGREGARRRGGLVFEEEDEAEGELVVSISKV
ncbi:hypothetical protein DFH11DRAFT_250393 [Phellopilus nigrolimitatus]|nr:hypothetical protein DFH11DRAFT_250393 [Phellopilus nigrolimitatus]